MTDRSDLKTMTRLDRRVFLGALLASAAVAAVPGLADLEPVAPTFWETNWTQFTVSYSVDVDPETGKNTVTTEWRNQDEVTTQEVVINTMKEHPDTINLEAIEDAPAEDHRQEVAQRNFEKRKAKWGEKVALEMVR